MQGVVFGQAATAHERGHDQFLDGHGHEVVEDGGGEGSFTVCTEI